MAFLAPLIPLIASVIGAGGALGSSFINRGTAEQQAKSTAPTGAQGVAPAGSPGVSPESFRDQSTAHWQQLLGNLGQGVEGGGLPADIQSQIDKQASLLG